MSNYKDIIAGFKSKKILVVGDVILDQHITGTVSRISPEAPVPVVLQEGESSYAPGGAANVANNLKSLDASVTILGRIGADAEGKILLKELKKRRISTEGIFIDPRMPTILKTRIVAQNQQVVRIDRERTGTENDGKVFRRAMEYLSGALDGFDAVIISDYGKGMISRQLVEQICALAIQKKKILTVDPKVEHFGYYRGVTSITPNRKEAENAIRNIKITHPQNGKRRLDLTSDQLKTLSDVEKAGEQLLRFLELESLLITLGNEGMYLFEKGKRPAHIPTRAREVFDVTGAGDTVIAVFTLGLSVGAGKHQAADLANFAAGIVVGHRGSVPVEKKELLEAIKE